MTAVLEGVEIPAYYRQGLRSNSSRGHISRALWTPPRASIEILVKERIVSLPDELADLLFEERGEVGSPLELDCYVLANKNNGYTSGFRFHATYPGIHYVSEQYRFQENTLEFRAKSLAESIADGAKDGLRAVLKYLRKPNGEIMLDENRMAIFDNGIIVL